MTSSVEEWVDEVARYTRPDRVYWCNGSEAEYRTLTNRMLADGTLIHLDEEAHPNSYLHRSDPSDVARTEHLTFICSENPEDAGPTNNWLSPREARERAWPLFDGAMQGRTMYVVPYTMGPADSPFASIGVEITDSAYVVANMHIMARVGHAALDKIKAGAEWVPGLHSTGDLSPERRYIMHFPETRTIWSIGSGYGGNALLGKKCHALRIASVIGRDQGWMAEHMLLMGLESPEGDITYIAGAFPSSCGKTNLAMLHAPEFAAKGWKVHTLGDDIVWIRVGEDGRLWAMNPENGYFGVAPGTSDKTNHNAMQALSADTIFTNVAVTDDGKVWWEGMEGPVPERLTDWKGDAWTPESGTKAAHPNARFTTPARRNPVISDRWEDPRGVPLSAILFGGRRKDTVPLVVKARDWEHGVYMGATMASETTAASTGQVGVVRRDPMAMLPFAGYNIADYLGHWLRMGQKATRLPLIFQVNWFTRDEDGAFIWPGFGENLRVLQWVRAHVRGEADGLSIETPLGQIPTPEALGLKELGLSASQVGRLFRIDPDEWSRELADQERFLATFGDRLPRQIRQEHEMLKERLTPVAVS